MSLITKIFLLLEIFNYGRILVRSYLWNEWMMTVKIIGIIQIITYIMKLSSKVLCKNEAEVIAYSKVLYKYIM